MYYRRNGGKESRRRRARQCPDCGIQRSFFTSPTHPKGWYGYHGYCILCHIRRSNLGTCSKCPLPKIVRHRLVCSCGWSEITDKTRLCPRCGNQMHADDPTRRFNPDNESSFKIIKPYGLIEVELTEWLHPYTGKPIAQVKWITVDEERQGFGSKLYDLAAQKAKKLGYHLASDDDLSGGALGYWLKQERLGRAEQFYYDYEEGPTEQEFSEGFDLTIFIMD